MEHARAKTIHPTIRQETAGSVCTLIMETAANLRSWAFGFDQSLIPTSQAVLDMVTPLFLPSQGIKVIRRTADGMAAELLIWTMPQNIWLSIMEVQARSLFICAPLLNRKEAAA